MFFAKASFYVFLFLSALCCAADKADKGKLHKKLKSSMPKIYIQNNSHRAVAFWQERAVVYTTDPHTSFTTYGRSAQKVVKPTKTAKMKIYHPDKCYKKLHFKGDVVSPFESAVLCPTVFIGIRIADDDSPEAVTRLEFDIEKGVCAVIKCQTERNGVAVLSDLCELAE